MNALFNKLPYLCLLFACCFGAFLFHATDKPLKYAILFSSMIAFCATFSRKDSFILLKEYLRYISPWLPWFFGIFTLTLIHSGKHIYLDSFLLLSLPFLALYKTDIKRHWVLYVIAFSCLSLSLAIILEVYTNGLSRDIFNINKNILLPSIALLMSVCLATLIFNCKNYPFTLIALLVLSILTTLVAIVFTEVRTALLALVGQIPLVIFAQKKHRIKTLVIVLSMFFAMLIVFFQTGRLQQGYSDLIQYQAGNPDSSWGIRLELWKLSFDAFLSKPFLGWGEMPFQEILNSGFSFPVPTFVIGHAHSDFFNMLVCLGLLGVSSWLITIVFVIRSSLGDPLRLSIIFACLMMGLTERLWFENRACLYMMSTVWVLLYLSDPTTKNSQLNKKI